MPLSDVSLHAVLRSGELVVTPLAADAVQPCSIDVRLEDRFRVFSGHRYGHIDPYALPGDLTRLVTVAEGEAFVLHPGEFVLAATLERVTLPAQLLARVEGKSSLGRLGLQVHATAGVIDPGFDGQITLELSNVASLPVLLWPGMPVAQLVVDRLDVAAARPYGHGADGSRYQGQTGPVASRFDVGRVRPDGVAAARAGGDLPRRG